MLARELNCSAKTGAGDSDLAGRGGTPFARSPLGYGPASTAIGMSDHNRSFERCVNDRHFALFIEFDDSFGVSYVKVDESQTHTIDINVAQRIYSVVSVRWYAQTLLRKSALKRGTSTRLVQHCTAISATPELLLLLSINIFYTSSVYKTNVKILSCAN